MKKMLLFAAVAAIFVLSCNKEEKIQKNFVLRDETGKSKGKIIC